MVCSLAVTVQAKSLRFLQNQQTSCTLASDVLSVPGSAKSAVGPQEYTVYFCIFSVKVTSFPLRNFQGGYVLIVREMFFGSALVCHLQLTLRKFVNGCLSKCFVQARILHKLPFFFSLVFEEPEDPSNRSFFSEIISSISDVKFSHSGRYMMTRDYLSVKIWDLNMENRPVETYQVFAVFSFNQYIAYLLLSLYREGFCTMC